MVFTLTSDKGYAQLDIFLKYPKTFEELAKNADRMTIDGLELLVSSKEDLIFAKQSVSPMRDKDEDDVKYLKKLLNKNE